MTIVSDENPIQNYAALLSKGNKASKFKEQKKAYESQSKFIPRRAWLCNKQLE